MNVDIKRHIYDKRYRHSEKGKKTTARKRYKEYIKRLDKRMLRVTSEITVLERELTNDTEN